MQTIPLKIKIKEYGDPKFSNDLIRDHIYKTWQESPNLNVKGVFLCMKEKYGKAIFLIILIIEFI